MAEFGDVPELDEENKPFESAEVSNSIDLDDTKNSVDDISGNSAAGRLGDDLEAQPNLEKVATDSARFISSWHELVSQTNWQKGEIICQWREKVCAIHEEIRTVSDRAWAQLIGGVTPEHVGRLRRTYERFGEVHENYEHLKWTHFMVATAWDDAEMWLEGASQNRWTIDQMRRTRWESMGAVEEQRPSKDDVVVEEIAVDELDRPVSQADGDVIEGPILEGPDWGESENKGGGSKIESSEIDSILKSASDEFVQGYQALVDAIQNCRDEDWKEFKRKDAFKLLAYLKQLVRQ